MFQYYINKLIAEHTASAEELIKEYMFKGELPIMTKPELIHISDNRYKLESRVEMIIQLTAQNFGYHGA